MQRPGQACMASAPTPAATQTQDGPCYPQAVLVAMTSHAFQRRTAMRHREAIKEAQANTKEATEAQDLALVVQR